MNNTEPQLVVNCLERNQPIRMIRGHAPSCLYGCHVIVLFIHITGFYLLSFFIGDIHKVLFSLFIINHVGL